MTRDLEQSLSKALEAYAGIVCVYLFGSFAEGRSHAQSDVDIGVLLDRREYPSSADRFEARVRLAAALEHDLAPGFRMSSCSTMHRPRWLRASFPPAEKYLR